MFVPKSKYEEPDSLKQAWLSIEGIRRVKMATVLVDTMIYGEVYVQAGSATLALAQMLLAAGHRTLGERINKFSVVINDGVAAPIDFSWTTTKGWQITEMLQVQHQYQEKRNKRRP